jgi:tetratricopeptide (TPR) repeat protein
MNPVPGLRIGPYRLVEAIGEGGMGVVWKARDTALDRDVAIKFLPPAFARDPERLARFEREAKAVAALSHPGILAIYGFGEHEGSAYAVTELLEGQTLRGALAEGALAPGRAVEIARQVARALAAAHERGIIHRDLKPENVFVMRDGHAKVLDFGLAGYVAVAGTPGAPSDATHTPTRTSLTAPGAVMGTTDYLSPEQIRGLATDARSDIFSFGSMLFEMLTGRRPFRRATEPETMTAILREEPPPAPGVAPALDRIARRCLEKTREARYASARDLAAALDTAALDAAVLDAAAVDVAALAAAAPGAAAAARKTGARRVRRVAAPIAVGLLLAGSAGYVVRKWVAPPAGPGRPGGQYQVSLSSIGEPPSANTDANESFEKGLLFIRAQLDIERARTMLDRAIALDPGFGSARSVRALLDVIMVHEGFANDGGLIYDCESAMRDLIARQPDLASAHGTLGAALLYLNRKEQAREEFEAARRLSPEAQTGLSWMTIDDRYRGRLELAENRARGVLHQVPLFWAMRIILSDILFDQGRVDEARHEIDKVFEQDPANLGALRAMARVQIYQGDLKGARARLEGISAATHPNFRVRLLWALLLAREGQSAAALAALDAPTVKYAGLALFAPAQAAEIYALAGHSDDALDWLDRAVRSGDERAEWFRRDAFLESIRTQPRFGLILEAIERGKR